MENADKVEVARRAIKQLGGPAEAHRTIVELTGKPLSYEVVKKWNQNGIAVPWHPVIHQLTGIPLHELEPEVYPSYLFVAKAS